MAYIGYAKAGDEVKVPFAVSGVLVNAAGAGYLQAYRLGGCLRYVAEKKVFVRYAGHGFILNHKGKAEVKYNTKYTKLFVLLCVS